MYVNIYIDVKVYVPITTWRCRDGHAVCPHSVPYLRVPKSDDVFVNICIYMYLCRNMALSGLEGTVPACTNTCICMHE